MTTPSNADVLRAVLERFIRTGMLAGAADIADELGLSIAEVRPAVYEAETGPFSECMSRCIPGLEVANAGTDHEALIPTYGTLRKALWDAQDQVRALQRRVEILERLHHRASGAD